MAVNVEAQRVLGSVHTGVRLVADIALVLVRVRSAEHEILIKTPEVDLVTVPVEVVDDVPRKAARFGRRLGPGFNDKAVVPGAERDNVEAIACGDHVDTTTAGEQVLAGIADNDVVAAAAGCILDHHTLG